MTKSYRGNKATNAAFHRPRLFTFYFAKGEDGHFVLLSVVNELDGINTARPSLQPTHIYSTGAL